MSMGMCASPWLEANDPFLRSSLLLLSDSGHLISPVNHYPLRWSMFGDDLTSMNDNAEMVSMAEQELQYTLNSAKLNRGNRLLKVLQNSNSALPMGFGYFNEDQKGIYSSYEQLSPTYSYRLSVGYSEYQDDSSIDWNDSYLAFSAGEWLWSIGSLDRWWGQGWQHNLILGSYAKAVPDISVSYLGRNDVLGVWSVESILSRPSDSIYDYHNATRLVFKPLSFFEYGVTYQQWLEGLDANGRDEQLGLDAKLTLPSIGHLYHSVYAEAASTAEITELGAWLVGWSGAFPVGRNTARIVLESQQTTSAHDTTQWNANQYPSMSKNVANTTYLLDSSESIAFYLQFANDHQLGVAFQHATQENEKRTTSQLTYRFPALAGRVHLGAGYQAVDSADNHTNVWAGYEFRF